MSIAPRNDSVLETPDTHEETGGRLEPCRPVDPRSVTSFMTVRGPLLTVRLENTLWVLRAGPDPRAWRKNLDRRGNGIGGWEPCRPPLDALLRPAGAFPPAADSVLEKYREESQREREWEGGGEAGELGEYQYAWDPLGWDESVRPCETDRPRTGRRKGKGPFPWAWIPGQGERLIRREEPDPDLIGWFRERPPSEREWRRIPRGGHCLNDWDPPVSLRDSTYRRLRATIRRVSLLRRGLPEWTGYFPDGAMKFLERHGFETRRWHLINLWIRVPEGRELWDDIPALAWMAASSWLSKSKPVKKPFRSLRALVRQPRSRLLRWLDLPAGEGTLNLLRSVNPSLMSPRFAHALRRVLRDDDKRRAWHNLSKPVRELEIRILAYDFPITFPVMRLINEDRKVGPIQYRQSAEKVYGDCLRMIRTLGRGDELRPRLARVRSGDRLLAFHDELVDEWDGEQDDYAFWREACSSGENQPKDVQISPPIAPTPEMRPLETAAELRQEGRWMHHCVAGYRHDVVGGDYYAYAVMHPQWGRATLGVRRFSDGTWRVEELRGPRNRDVPSGMWNWLNQWIRETPATSPPRRKILVADVVRFWEPAMAIRPTVSEFEPFEPLDETHLRRGLGSDPLIEAALRIFGARVEADGD